MSNPDSIYCWVYRCPRKPEMYVYLAEQDDFESIPATLRGIIGPMEPVIDLELTPQRKLARVDVIDVLASLHEQRFYIQLPPGRPLTEPN